MCRESPLQGTAPLGVVDLAALEYVFAVRAALGDDEFSNRVIAVQAQAEVAQALGVDFPTEIRALQIGLDMLERQALNRRSDSSLIANIP